MTDVSISVVIPAYNCASTIAKTIDAVLHQSYSQEIEVIVVDDGSADDTPTVIKSFSKVLYVHQNNAGPACARNNGFYRSSGDVVFFTDADCIPNRDWIQKAIRHFDDDTVGVVAGSYEIANPENMLARCIHKEIIFRHTYLMPKYPKCFGSYNFCVKRNVFNQVKGFDIQYRAASGEDNDLSYKILKTGYRIYFDKDCRVSHYHPTRLVKYFREQFRHGFWRAKMYYGHPEMSRGDDYTFWKDIIEPPAVLLFVIAIFLSYFSPHAFLIALYSLFCLLILELTYSMYIVKSICESLFYGGVMHLRAFFRTFGFILGSLRFLPINISKYSK